MQHFSGWLLICFCSIYKAVTLKSGTVHNIHTYTKILLFVYCMQFSECWYITTLWTWQVHQSFSVLWSRCRCTAQSTVFQQGFIDYFCTRRVFTPPRGLIQPTFVSYNIPGFFWYPPNRSQGVWMLLLQCFCEKLFSVRHSSHTQVWTPPWARHLQLSNPRKTSCMYYFVTSSFSVLCYWCQCTTQTTVYQQEFIDYFCTTLWLMVEFRIVLVLFVFCFCYGLMKPMLVATQ